MKIAVFTKPTLMEHPVRKAVLAAVSASEKFVIQEISANSSVPSDCERLLAFGGDGTMLEAAVRAAEADIPLVGVNCGNLGFLTQFDSANDTDDIIKALLEGKTVKRMLLECSAGDRSFLALNDIVVKSADTHPVSVQLYVDGQFADAYRSDGMIVATPTGSTAYSLSAGGPVLAPELDALTVNAVCPHTLHSRPLVVGAEALIEMRIMGGDSALLVVDGSAATALGANATVKVKKAAVSASFVDAGNKGFYEKLLDKMNRWGLAQSAEVTDL